MYVIRTCNGRVKYPPSQGTAKEIEDHMIQYCEYCVMPGHSLLMLKRVIGGVYKSLLKPAQTTSNAQPPETATNADNRTSTISFEPAKGERQSTVLKDV